LCCHIDEEHPVEAKNGVWIIFNIIFIPTIFSYKDGQGFHFFGLSRLIDTVQLLGFGWPSKLKLFVSLSFCSTDTSDQRLVHMCLWLTLVHVVTFN
jgi:hypothetical protein